ncbi:MAG: hypothetical protein ABW065_02445 [Solirubrobacterales bacterium]
MAMTGKKRAGWRFPRRRACLVALGLTLSLGAAGALAAVVPPAQRSTVSTRLLSVRVNPSSQTVVPGASARYVIDVARPNRGTIGLSGLTGLGVAQSGLPVGADVSFSPQRGLAALRGRPQRTVLEIATAPGTPVGTYTLRVRVRRLQRTGSTDVSMVVSSPDRPVAPAAPVAPTAPPTVRAPEAFTIAGSLTEPLAPGSGEPLDLTLTNRESSDLAISSLVVTVADVTAPRSDPTHSCDVEDFSVEQFSGGTGFTLPALGTASLGALGFSASELPQISMLNLPVNQNGCKGAALTLAFAGTATEVTP